MWICVIQAALQCDEWVVFSGNPVGLLNAADFKVLDVDE
jgi:hypothetical protein